MRGAYTAHQRSLYTSITKNTAPTRETLKFSRLGWSLSAELNRFKFMDAVSLWISLRKGLKKWATPTSPAPAGQPASSRERRDCLEWDFPVDQVVGLREISQYNVKANQNSKTQQLKWSLIKEYRSMNKGRILLSKAPHQAYMAVVRNKTHNEREFHKVIIS